MIGFYGGLAVLSGLLHAMSTLCLKHALMHEPAKQSATSRSFIQLSSLCGVPVVLWQIGRLPYAELWQPVVTGLVFYMALRCANLAVAKGAASLVLPLLGSKVVFTAILAALLLERMVGASLWVACGLVCLGVCLLGRSGNSGLKTKQLDWKSRSLVVLLALAAAASLALVDTLIVYFRESWGLYTFLSMLFLVTGTCAVLEDRNQHPLRALTSLFRDRRPMLLVAAGLNILQTIGIAAAVYYSARVAEMNVLYASRSLWVVALAYALSRFALFGEGDLRGRVLGFRIAGAFSICLAIVLLCVSTRTTT